MSLGEPALPAGTSGTLFFQLMRYRCQYSKSKTCKFGLSYLPEPPGLSGDELNDFASVIALDGDNDLPTYWRFLRQWLELASVNTAPVRFTTTGWWPTTIRGTWDLYRKSASDEATPLRQICLAAH